MMKYFLLALGVLLMVIGAAAQTKEYEAPAGKQGYGMCLELMVQELYKATDPNDPQQENHLKAAEAYRLLSEAGQRC